MLRDCGISWVSLPTSSSSLLLLLLGIFVRRCSAVVVLPGHPLYHLSVLVESSSLFHHNAVKSSFTFFSVDPPIG